MFSVLPDVVMSYLDCDSGSARRAAIIAFLAKGWHLPLFPPRDRYWGTACERLPNSL